MSRNLFFCYSYWDLKYFSDLTYHANSSLGIQGLFWRARPRLPESLWKRTRLIFLLCVLDRVASFKLYLVHSLRMQTESFQFNCKCNIWKKKKRTSSARSGVSTRTTRVICAQPVGLAVTWSFLDQLIPFWFNSPYDWLSARLTVGKISLYRPRP